jgi:drug/metabolite transporter (DMT)-like permease
MTRINQSNFKGYIYLLITAVIWGIAFAFQVAGSESLGTFYFNCIRFFIGGIVLLPLAVFIHRKDLHISKTEIIGALMIGSFLVAASSFQQMGVSISHNASKAGFVTSLYVLIVPIYRYLLYKKKIGGQTWVGLTLSVIGLYFLTSKGGTFDFEIEDIYFILSVFIWGGHILMIDYFAPKAKLLFMSSFGFIWAGFVSLIFALFTETISFEAVSNGLVPILYLGLASTAIGYTCQMFGQKYVSPTKSALILNLETIFSALGGWVILGQGMTWIAAIGCGIMFVGIVVGTLAP